MHLLEDVVEIVSVDVIAAVVGDSEETNTTVIGEVDEDMGVLVRLEGGTVAVIAQQNVEEILRSHIVALVVGVGCIVDVCGVELSLTSGIIDWLVEELTWVWVPIAANDIVVGQVDNMISWDAIGEHDLDCVVSISLMAVVAISVGAGHDDSPVVTRVSGSVGSECSGDERSHYLR